MNITTSTPHDLDPDLDPDVILNAYAEGKANTAFHLDCADRITDQAHRYVTLCFTGGAAAIGYTVHLFDHSAGPPAWGVLFAGIHLFLIGAWLVTTCMRPGEYWPPVNEGINFLMPHLRWHEILRGEIENIAERTIDLRTKNNTRATTLHRLATAALCCPATFAAAWWVATMLA